ncbi:MAG: DNA internalization-related competence protein ComEC/Rec2 [Nitrospinae bacterium]|nr:DNA internalization-related competence protein ComEC/Rec2 [Nitrospinota bacterium]
MLPLLPYFLAYAGGILTALPASSHFLFPYFLPLSSVAGGAFAYWKVPDRRPLGWVWLALLYCFGFLAPGWQELRKPENHILSLLREGKPADIVARLEVPPAHFSDRTQYVVELVSAQYGEEAVAVAGRARINLYARENSFGPGDLLRFKKVRLKRPRNFHNPGRFDFEGYMEFLGISVSGSVSRPENVERIGAFPLPGFSAAIEKVKGRMLREIDASLGPDESALLKAMLLGEKESLPESVNEVFIVTGLAHLMAVSGLNFAFVAGAAFLAVYPLTFHALYLCLPGAARAGHARKISAFLVLFPVLFYMVLVGAKVSALRAGIMIVIYLLAALIGREHDVMNALLAAALALLSWNPGAIENISFQLSFVAVLSILLALLCLLKIPGDAADQMGRRHAILRSFRNGALVSVAAGLGTLPLLVLYFNRVSWIGFLLNILMVPVASLLVPLALFTLSAGLLWGGLMKLLMPVCSLLLKSFVVVLPFFASIPHASVYVPTPPQLWFVLWYFVLFGAPYWYYRQQKFARSNPGSRSGLWNKPLATGLALASLCLAVGFVWPRLLAEPSETLTVGVLDVGQGESIFMEFPNRQVMVIDGGGFYKNAFDIGKAVVAPFLWSQGIGRIDYMAATHSDNDHVSGLESLVKLFPVGHYFVRPEDVRDTRLRNLRLKARIEGAREVRLAAGEPFEVGDVRITPLHPDEEFVGRGKRRPENRIGNESSLVLRVDYRKFSMLLTGDIGEKAERYLVAHGAPLQADVLKVPHHGSGKSSSPEFVRAVAPRTAVVSSGYLNRFGHPDPAVVDRYRRAGAQVWRTDLQGAITVQTDGLEFQVRGFKP